ncbi:MAG: EAL domain-containing protein [Candidatus Dormibacteria bacterium]
MTSKPRSRGGRTGRDAGRDLRALQGLVRELASNLDYEEVLDRLTRASVNLLGDAVATDPAATATLYRIDEGWCRTMAHHGPPGTHPGEVVEQVVANPILARAAVDNRGFAFRFDREPDLVAAGSDEAGLMSGACAIVRSGGRSVGALVVCTSVVADIPPDTLSVLQSAADLAALAVSNAESYRLVADSAATDFLTGLPNRREFERQLGTITDTPFAVLAIDIDNLKVINDEYGHQAGDGVLQAIARGLRGGLRGRDVLARVGGDEFAALVVGADQAQAAAVAERMRQVLRGLDVPFGHKQVSVGLAAGPAHGDTREVWGRAHEALLRAKRLGGDRVEATKDGAPHMNPGVRHWAEVVPSMLAPGRIDAVYQPIVRLADRSLVGWEALARPAGGDPSMSVDALFATAIRMGHGRDIDWFCRRAAVHGASHIPAGVQIFINVSIPALLDPLHEVDQMLLLLRWARRSPWDIVLEISEREAVADMARLKEVLAEYRDHGFRFAMDDVGEGHSTLEVLAAASPEYIKIARSLTLGAEQPGPRAATSALVAFATSAGATVIAEGIETPRDAEVMAELGVELGQGYGFGRPSARAEYLAPQSASAASRGSVSSA